MKFTVLGSTGFIGQNMVRHLQARGFQVKTPPRGVAGLRGGNLGHVIYAIGLTGNFRSQPQATIEAHVNVLQRLMEDADFDSWLYLSSTRIYGGLSENTPAAETAALSVRPGLDAIYDLSKLLGESVCLGKDRSTIRVARLSNVYGAGQSEHSFLGSVIRDLACDGKVIIGESPQSSKDYIPIDRVVKILESIAIQGRDRIYNVAAGCPVSHQALAEIIQQCGYTVEFCPEAPTRIFPTIDTTRVNKEFGRDARCILADLLVLIEKGNEFLTNTHA